MFMFEYGTYSQSDAAQEKKTIYINIIRCF